MPYPDNVIRPEDADITDIGNNLSVCLDTQGDNNEELIIVITDKHGNHTILPKDSAYKLFVWLENHRLDMIMEHKLKLDNLELPE